MSQAQSKNPALPIFEVISPRARQAINADYFVLIVYNPIRKECRLFVDHQIKNRGTLEKELLQKVAEIWKLRKKPECKFIYESIDNPGSASVCSILGKMLDCRSILQVPYEIDEDSGGYIIWCWKKGPSDFSKGNREKAMLISEQVALSLKLSLKERQSLELNAKLAALLELSTVIYSSLNYKDVLEKAVNLSMKIVGADGGTIFTLDKKAGLIRPLITIDSRHEEEISKIVLKKGEGITGLVVQNGAGIISNHSETDPRAFHVPGTPDDEPESIICAPLTWSGEIIGAITLRSTEGKQFIQEDLDILTIFARQTADAIENAKLYESLEKAYKDLSSTQEQLIMSEKLRALGEMAGGVAHDFNNVLGAILGRVQLLLKETGDDRLARQLKQIENVTLDGARTVQKLQNFTRVSQSGQFDYLDLNKAIDDAIEATRPRWKDECQRQGILIDLTFEKSESLPVMGNRTELIEVFSNIILNAVDALNKGGYVKIKSSLREARAVVEITDNGVGMSEDLLNRVFFPFFTTKGKRGTGMGLAVVYGIVSKVDRGTTFSLSFPITEKTESRVEKHVEVGREIKARVLVIDDDENIRSVVGDILSFLGHEVIPAVSGEEGVELFKADKFDLVITDLGMPGISGWEVARLCKSINPAIPVILISGWGNQIDDEMIKQSRLDGVLTKPFEMNKMKDMIQYTLNKETVPEK
jgi:signal transduction histidine kinase/ActR/RegA family two-component response regulator